MKKLIYNEKYHDNCHDYLKKQYIEKYAVEKYKKFLYEIKYSIPKINICHDTDYDLYGDIIVCDQHAVILTNDTDIYPVLATYALNACVGLIFYCKKYRIGALAHIDGLPGYSKQSAIDDGLKIDFDPVSENINLILKNFRNLTKSKEKITIEYYLIGGIFELSEVMVYDIVKCLNKINGKNNFKFQFMGRNILGPANQSRNICFNTKTGRITYFDYLINYEYHENYLGENGLPINIIKAPRKSEAFLDLTYLAEYQ